MYFEGIHILNQTVEPGRYVHICGRINEKASNNDELSGLFDEKHFLRYKIMSLRKVKRARL